jgi:hypothetical protein
MKNSLVNKLKYIILFFLLSKITFLFGQENQQVNSVNYKEVFTEIKVATTKAKSLWSKNLYAPILFVEPKTREIISNESSEGLKLENGLYVGKLPENINIANTAVKWNDKMWAMIMLPLPDDKFDRINLIAHELFHKVQPELGFNHADPINGHLDKIAGRIYLTLELEALKKALLDTDTKEQHKHIINALTFRKHRQNLFTGSENTENKIEVNEGITEYTGFMIADRPSEIAVNHFIVDINSFLETETFVRSFTFHTIPIYGFLLSKTNIKWNKKIKNNTNLTTFFTNKFNYEKPNEAIDILSKNYGYTSIFEKEKKREEEINKKIAHYKNLFLNTPCLKLVFEKMNVSFNTSNIIPLDSLGTVYPTIRVTDNWGILEVTEGALMEPKWKYITVSNLIITDDKTVTGKGWTLKLNENHKIVKDGNTGNFIIEK